MKFRTRLALALVVSATVPLAVLGFGVRRGMTQRLDQEAGVRAATLDTVLRTDFANQFARLRSRVQRLASALAADNRFRLAAREAGTDRRWLLDWAPEAMGASGLAVLRLQDEQGRVLSSGHFRNEFDRLDPELPAALASARAGEALVRFRAPDGELLALAVVDSLRVSDRTYRLVGGLAFDTARVSSLIPTSELTVGLVLGDAGQPNAAITLPYYNAVTGGPVGTAQLVIQRDPSLLLGIRRDVNGLMAVSLGLSLLLALVLAVGLASQVSRPLAELAEKTGRVELDRLDVDFASPRDDEVGALANLLAAMTARLRASAAQLRDAERRAVTGELARQINHDVKNGLAPIRHVLRHLGETAVKSPERLALVFAERRETLESSVGYLEELARNYARLAPVLDRGPSDLGALLEEVARGARTDSVQIEVRLAPELPRVKADLVVLRRITENLLSNAVDALERGTGRVTLAAEPVAAPEPLVRLQVTDSGRGMTQEELGRAFDDFHTTKPSGTGLGLSVVRRLVADLGGSLRVESRPGQGSTFSVEIPAA